MQANNGNQTLFITELDQESPTPKPLSNMSLLLLSWISVSRIIGIEDETVFPKFLALKISEMILQELSVILKILIELDLGM